MRGQVVRERFAPRLAVFGRDGARARATPLQYVIAISACVLLGWSWRSGPIPALHTLHAVVRAFFIGVVALRLSALALGRPPAAIDLPADDELPSYTVILPLYREAAVVPALIRGLRALDYPADRIEFLFALEPHDRETWAAVARERPANGRIVVSAPGGPRTKPHACNCALSEAAGELVVVFDAEDRPHPQQLREAVARFRAGPDELVCLQAPLRVLRATGFLQRQFALEYAVLFDVTLPALVRAGLPFPLGGTSNHFKREALRAVGGWDAWNVTEDADLGLRLGACGGRLGLLDRPTEEPAPPTLDVWTPQRTRWIKGHIHTWLVHMRRPLHGGLRSILALQLTLGLNVSNALMHGPLAVGVAACVLFGLASVAPPAIAATDLSLLLAGYLSAGLAMVRGAKRAGYPISWRDLALAPLYWPLQSLAGAFALWELIRKPHHWNKTPHLPVEAADVEVAAA